MSSPRRTRGSQTPSRNGSEADRAPGTPRSQSRRGSEADRAPGTPRSQPVAPSTPSSRTRRGQAAGLQTPTRNETSPPPRRTPMRSSRSGTPASTPLRSGARRPAAGQDNVVEPSDPLSLPPSSPGHNIMQPTSPLGVGECHNIIPHLVIDKIVLASEF